MKTILTLLMIGAVIAPAAVAGEMTPEQVMQKFMTCVSCAPYMEYPEFQTGLTFDTQKTAHGMIVAEMLTDASLVGKFRECEEKLAVTRAEVAKMSAAEAQEKLCPICAGFHSLMARGDVELENVQLESGAVTLASAETEDGVAAIHAYVDEANKVMAMMEAASAEMKEPAKE